MNSGTDKLKIYFGDDLRINKFITVHNPVINDIIETGEQEYFSMVNNFCAIPSDMKSVLWDAGIDWTEISDYELFCHLVTSFPLESTKILFGDLDFTKFELGRKIEIDEPVLYQEVELKDGTKDLIIIDQHIYLLIVEFLRSIHRIKPKVEKAATKTVKQILINEDRAKRNLNKDKPFESILFPLVSSLVNTAEFKYGVDEVRNMSLYAFMDSVTRIQLVKSSDALLKGCYGGMIDTSKINKKDLNWMRDID